MENERLRFLVLLVNDSEYNNFTGQKPIQCYCGIYLVSPGALQPPHPALPPCLGAGKYQKNKSPVASAVALGHFCVGVGVVMGLIRW